MPNKTINRRRRHRTWDDWYNDALKYFEEHGDLKVPAKYRTTDGYWLGNWIYEWVCEYLKENGKLPLSPKNLKSPDGRCVPDWIRNQEKLMTEGQISDEHRKQLEKLGLGIKKQGDG